MSKLPFHGELMTCHRCGRTQLHDPNVTTDWNCFQFEGVNEKGEEAVIRFYFCPDCLDLKKRLTRVSTKWILTQGK